MKQIYKGKTCKGGDILDNYIFENPVLAAHDAFLQMKKQKDNYASDLSSLDGAISDLSHDVERVYKSGSMDMYTGYLFAKRWGELLDSRRNLKEQNEQIKSIERFFNLRNSLENMDRAILKQGKEMPKRRLTRQEDLLVKGHIKLKNGWEV